ncbi:MAG: hypothetical protein ACSHX7_06070 [Luteolibacter sp.]
MLFDMNDNMKESADELSKDLSNSWIELSKNVRNLADELAGKARETSLATDAEKLATQATSLCNHVDRLHADAIDLLQNMDNKAYIPSTSGSSTEREEVLKEAIQVNREHHEGRSDFKDVLKALFMWRDDPAERVRSKE